MCFKPSNFLFHLLTSPIPFTSSFSCFDSRHPLESFSPSLSLSCQRRLLFYYWIRNKLRIRWGRKVRMKDDFESGNPLPESSSTFSISVNLPRTASFLLFSFDSSASQESGLAINHRKRRRKRTLIRFNEHMKCSLTNRRRKENILRSLQKQQTKTWDKSLLKCWYTSEKQTFLSLKKLLMGQSMGKKSSDYVSWVKRRMLTFCFHIFCSFPFFFKGCSVQLWQGVFKEWEFLWDSEEGNPLIAEGARE